MSDQEAPKRRAGSINRYTTLGNARTRERSDVAASGSTDAQTSESPSVDTPVSPGPQESRSENVQEHKHPDVEELTRSNVQEEKRPRARTPRERHTIYLPPDLSEWVKIRAVKTKREISEIVTEAVERYRQEEEDI